VHCAIDIMDYTQYCRRYGHISVFGNKVASELLLIALSETFKDVKPLQEKNMEYTSDNVFSDIHLVSYANLNIGKYFTIAIDCKYLRTPEIELSEDIEDDNWDDEIYKPDSFGRYILCDIEDTPIEAFKNLDSYNFHSSAIFAFCYFSYKAENIQAYEQICNSLFSLKHKSTSVVILPVAIDRMIPGYLDKEIVGKCAIESNGTINILPDEIMLQIFKIAGFENISNIALTCARWSKLCKDVTLWNYFKQKSRASAEIILGDLQACEFKPRAINNDKQKK